VGGQNRGWNLLNGRTFTSLEHVNEVQVDEILRQAPLSARSTSEYQPLLDETASDEDNVTTT